MGAYVRNYFNRTNGAGWEEIFRRQADRNGLLAKKVGLSARFIGPKKVVAAKSFLDFQLITPGGKVAFLDTKTWLKNYFTFSDIDENQLKKAVEYNKWGVPAGFVCLFRESNRVAFFQGVAIAELGTGNRFSVESGVALGMIGEFDLRRIFEQY